MEESVEKILGLFNDGFQLSDIWDALPMCMEIVESFGTLSGSEKKEKVLKIFDTLLDRVNLPGWDWLTKKAILWFLPGVIDKLVSASKGEYKF